MAMGGSLSPILSKLFMEYFETEILSTCYNGSWLRYVDDIFLIWPNNDDFNTLFNNVNNLHPCIKFKTEWEENYSLPFLDILVVRIPLYFTI